MIYMFEDCLVDSNNASAVYKIFEELTATDINTEERISKAIEQLKVLGEVIYAEHLKKGDVPGLVW